MDRVRSRLRSERGTTIVEVLVAAVILVVISGTVASMISAAQRHSGESRAIAIAGDLAQSELEQFRLRKFDDLVGADETVSGVSSGGLEFTVRRRAVWAMDDGQDAACEDAGSIPDALRLIVEVQSDQMRRPARLDTLVAAPVSRTEEQGTFIVIVKNRDGDPVPGLPVTMDGAGDDQTRPTDDNGCVRFTGLSEGDYTVRFQRAGWVDIKHRNLVEETVTVSGGELGNKTFEYDQGGGVHVRFRQRTGPGTTGPVAVPGASFNFQNYPLVGSLIAGNAEAVEPHPMWPASGQYAVYADSCAAGDALGGVTVTRGQMDPAPPTDLTLPKIALRITGLSNQDVTVNGARIKTACDTTINLTGTKTGTEWTSEMRAAPPGELQLCIHGTVQVWSLPVPWSLTKTYELGTTEPELNGTTQTLGSYSQARQHLSAGQVCT